MVAAKEGEIKPTNGALHYHLKIFFLVISLKSTLALVMDFHSYLYRVHWPENVLIIYGPSTNLCHWSQLNKVAISLVITGSSTEIFR